MICFSNVNGKNHFMYPYYVFKMIDMVNASFDLVK